MKIVLVDVSLHIPGCTSLKEKRSRISGIRDRFGSMKQVAVCESGDQNSHEKSSWSFVIIGLDEGAIQSTVSQIEDFLDSRIDAVVTNIDKVPL